VPTVSNPPRLTLPISVISVRAQAYSPDDQTVVISLTTKYSTPKELTLCRSDVLMISSWIFRG
jgi:hypothetical protein